MKSLLRFFFTTATFGFALLCFSERTPAADEARKPNIVFVLADDLGWAELGCYGNGFNETPHLDQLSREGMRFTQAYAAAPVCSPYRAALLTGKYPARTGILDYLRPNSANALSTQNVTLPEMLQENGYATGMIGKWHLTGYEFHEAEHEVKPRDHGFTWDFAREIKGVGNGANFWPYIFRTQPIRWLDIPENRLGDEEFLVDRMNLEAVDFIQRNHKKPFFLYLSHYATHTIMNGKPELAAKYRKKHRPGKSTKERCHLCQDHGHPGDSLNHWAQDHNPHLAAMLESIDDGIGMIQAKLDSLGIADDTIFIFSSDNGGETNVTSNAPLRGGKSQLYEGGIRVPLIVRWLGKVPEGSTCNQPISNIDFYPTLLDAVGVERDAAHQLDGISTLNTWKDASTKIERDAIYWHYPLDSPHFLGGVSSGAIRVGDWKLIEYFDTGKAELFSLNDDPSEQHDLSEKQPKVVASLRKKLVDWRRSVDARIPSPPMLISPRKLLFADHFSPKQVSSRWFFTKEWSAENGVLQRNTTGSENTRIFLKNAEYRNVMIRFDFQLRDAQDIRLVTGSGGNYNAVIHIHPDHFYIQTALDKSGPYFPYRHGECAYEFDPDRWYTMTVEFIGDQLVAHIDREHLAYAKHPILDKERMYFAFQVDEHSAAFDNIQMFSAAKHKAQEKNFQHITEVSGKYPVQKSLEEQFSIQKTNAHEWLYQRHEEYRNLIENLEMLDAKNKKRFSNIFRSHKEFQKEVSKLRKKMHAEDPVYKETLFATYRAARAIEAFLIAQQPEVAELPDSRKKREIEKLRVRFQKDSRYLELLKLRDEAQKKLESNYPKLFVTNEEISEFRKKQRKLHEDDPEFRKLIDDRAAAWRAQQAYLFEHDKKLAELKKRLEK